MSFDKKHWQLVTVLGLITAFGSVSIDMYLPAFPEITSDLHTKLSLTEYSLASFFLGLAIGQLIYGPISDRFGRKTPLLIGLVIYIISSIACAFAPTIQILIAARFIQALGCCAGMIVPRAAVRDLFERGEAARVFSSLMLIMGVSPILAPLLGGYLAKGFGWQSIFYLMAVLGVLGFVMAWFRFPETHKHENRHKSLNLKQIIITYWQLLNDKHFIGYSFSGSLTQAGLFAYITGSPYVLIEHYGIRPEHYGIFFGANAAGLIFASQLNRYLLKTRDIDDVLKFNMPALAIIGLALIIMALLNIGIIPMVFALFWYVAILGATSPNTAAGALSNQGKRAGAAAALLGAVQFTMAFIASSLVSILHNHTMFPMTGIMAFCGISGAILYFMSVQRLSNKL